MSRPMWLWTNAITAKMAAGSAIPLAALLVCPGSAAADPPPDISADPVAPAVPIASPPPEQDTAPWPSAPGAALSMIGGLTSMPDLSGAPVTEMLLGQTPTPAAPGEASVVLPGLNPLNNQYLLLQHVEPSVPGEGQLVGVEPGEENADVSRLDYLKRLYGTYRGGGLKGALLGQKPREEHVEPLEEVMAPPADVTALPSGAGQVLPEPPQSDLPVTPPPMNLP